MSTSRRPMALHRGESRKSLLWLWTSSMNRKYLGFLATTGRHRLSETAGHSGSGCSCLGSAPHSLCHPSILKASSLPLSIARKNSYDSRTNAAGSEWQTPHEVPENPIYLSRRHLSLKLGRRRARCKQISVETSEQRSWACGCKLWSLAGGPSRRSYMCSLDLALLDW